MPRYRAIKTESAATTARLKARLPIEVMMRLKRASEIPGALGMISSCQPRTKLHAGPIDQTEIIRLSIEDQRQIAPATLNPPEPSRQSGCLHEKGLVAGELENSAGVMDLVCMNVSAAV
jgi:hypothetical protein